jgi:hypothetical protein
MAETKRSKTRRKLPFGTLADLAKRIEENNNRQHPLLRTTDKIQEQKQEITHPQAKLHDR